MSPFVAHPPTTKEAATTLSARAAEYLRFRLVIYMDPSPGIPEEGPRKGRADYSAGLIMLAPPVITN